MDIQQLCAVLQGCLSADQEQRKQAEAILQQHELAPGQTVNLLRVAGEPSVDLAVRQVASIAFKQVAKRHWEPEEEGKPSALREEDKQAVRANLLDALIHAPHVIQSQLVEVLRTVAYVDYPERWPGLLDAAMAHLTSNDQPRMRGALTALRVLARKYEFRDGDERAPLQQLVNAAFPTLLQLMTALTSDEAAAAPPAQQQHVPEFTKLICKVFWSSTFMAVPPLLVTQEQFGGWMTAFHRAMRRPLPYDQLPSDPDARRKWPWFKALKWVLHITHRLFNRYGEPRLCNPGADQAFAQMFEAHVASQFLEDQLHVLMPLSRGVYVAPRACNLALQYLTRALELKAPYKQLKPHVEPLLGQVVLPLLCFDDEDAELWEEDPQEFVRKGYDVLEDIMGTKTAAANFVTTLATKKPKAHLPWLMARLAEVMAAHDAAAKAAGQGAVPTALARQMDGAMLAVGSLSDVLRGRDPYRSQVEPLLTTHVLPTLRSPHGHLRAKALWLAKEFAGYSFSDGGVGAGPLFNALLQAVINALHDPELPVRVEAVMALRAFVEELADAEPLKPILGQLMDSIFRLMSEVENEELVFTLEVIVDKFGDDIAPYAVTLARNLTAAFWKYSGAADGDDGDDEDDQAAVAAYGCLKALNTLLDGVAEMRHLLPLLEEIIFPIMDKCLSSDGQDVLEDVLELLAYFTYFGELTPRLWSLWPRLHALVFDFGVDYWENILVPLDNFISRGTEVYLAGSGALLQQQQQQQQLQQPGAPPPAPFDYQKSVLEMAGHTLAGEYDELSMVPAVKLLEVVLQNCPGRVDGCLQPYLALALGRLAGAETRALRDELLLLVANALYYNAAATVALLAQAGAVQQVFTAWFAAIFERTKHDKPAHFKTQHAKKAAVLGLLSLLGVPDEALPPQIAGGLPQLLAGLVRLLTDLKAQQDAAEAAKQEEDEEEEGGEDGDAAEDDGIGGGDDDDDGDGDGEADPAYMARLRREALRMLRGAAGGDDDDDDDEWSSDEEEEAVGTPLDDIDAFVSFAEALGRLQAAMPQRYAALVSGADAAVMVALQGMSQHAAEVRAKLEAEAAAGGGKGSGGGKK